MATAIGDLSTHALPLFGPTAQRKATSDAPKPVNGKGKTNGHTNGRGKRPTPVPQLTGAEQEIGLDSPAITNDVSDHALPLFGSSGPR